MVLFGVPPEEYWPYRNSLQDFDAEPPAFCYSFAQNYNNFRALIRRKFGFDGLASSQNEPKVRELHLQYYQNSEFELWDEYVTDVLEWLSRPNPALSDL